MLLQQDGFLPASDKDWLNSVMESWPTCQYHRFISIWYILQCCNEDCQLRSSCANNCTNNCLATANSKLEMTRCKSNLDPFRILTFLLLWYCKISVLKLLGNMTFTRDAWLEAYHAKQNI